MAIYFTGDTHGGIDTRKLNTKNFPEGKSLSKRDYLVVTGDFGIWNDKQSMNFLNWLDKTKTFTVLFVEGNHEDYTFLKTFPLIDKFNNKVRKINDSVYQLLRGEIYNIEGYDFFAFGGARSIDKFSARRQEGIDWFPEEESTYLEENNALTNLEKNGNKVDFIITHTCAKSTLDELSKLFGFYVEDYDNQSKFFEELKNTIEYKGWLFGHFHYDLIINDKEVLLYNRVKSLEELFQL